MNIKPSTNSCFKKFLLCFPFLQDTRVNISYVILFIEIK